MSEKPMTQKEEIAQVSRDVQVIKNALIGESTAFGTTEGYISKTEKRFNTVDEDIVKLSTKLKGIEQSQKHYVHIDDLVEINKFLSHWKSWRFVGGAIVGFIVTVGTIIYAVNQLVEMLKNNGG